MFEKLPARFAGWGTREGAEPPDEVHDYSPELTDGALQVLAPLGEAPAH